MTRLFRTLASAAALGPLVVLGTLPTSLPAMASPSTSREVSTRVIVLLKPSSGAARTRGGVLRLRAAALAAQEQPVVDHVLAQGGQVTDRYALIGGFAATVPSADLPALRARPDVAAVLPDRFEHLSGSERSTVPPSTPRSLPVSGSTVCPSDPAKPLLEPEALSIMRAASDEPSTPSASDLADGAGVKVGVIGNGIDVRNPDLRRADGSPVVVDYHDFVGTGTDAPAAASEATGDAASIAAQGRQTYDLASFGATPTGCTIRVRGVAPGAQVVVLKVTDGRGFYDSALVEAVDYAVEVAHVDVLNESLEDDPYPDTGSDPLSLANAAAVAAGVTVTAASGDGGLGSTIGPPSSSVPGSDGVISVGATSQLQLANQLGVYGPAATVRSGDIAGLSTSGFAQTGRVDDVVAPGYLGWSLCTDDPARYLDCPDFPGTAKGLQAFNGSSESAPLTAGVAALVIDRYRATHDGASPTPGVVKQIVTSTADDIGAPAQEQGAGEVDALRAVQLAGAVRDGSARTGTDDVLVGPTSLTVTPKAGHSWRTHITLDNPSGRTRHLVLSRRDQRVVGVSHVTASVPESHVVRLPFTVAPRTDRIAVTAGLHTAGGDYPELVLVDPKQTAANDTTAEGASSTNTVEADHPRPGRWQLILLTYAYTGTADVAVTSYRNTGRTVRRLTLGPGRHRSVRFRVSASAPGDRAFALTVRSASSRSVLTSVPVVVRTPVTLRAGHGTFRGAVNGGNGRVAVLFGTSSYLVRVPPGAPSLRVRIRLAHGDQRVDAYLTSPSGDALDEEDNLPPGSMDPTAGGTEVDLSAVHPQAGLWQVALGLNGIADPLHASTDFVGRVSLDRPAIRIATLPDSRDAVLPAGVAHTMTVHIRNASAVPHAYVVDPRLAGSSWLTLVQPGTVTVSGTDPSPAVGVVVPPQTTELSSTMTAKRPLAGSIAPGHFSFPGSNADPEVYDTSPTGTLRLDVSSRELQDGPWLELPTAGGPFSSTGFPAPFSVGLRAVVRTRTFDHDVTSSTGDPWLAAVGAPQAVTPLVVGPGATAELTVTIMPSGPAGHVVRGTLSVLGWDSQAGVSSGQAVFPYAYRVG